MYKAPEYSGLFGIAVNTIQHHVSALRVSAKTFHPLPRPVTSELRNFKIRGTFFFDRTTNSMN